MTFQANLEPFYIPYSCFHPNNMADDRLKRVIPKLQNLPYLSLPTDYPRHTGVNRYIESVHLAQLPEETSISLLRLALYDDGGNLDEGESVVQEDRPSAFHLLLAAFTILLHRYTGDNDIIIGSSSAAINEPLILCLSVEPLDPYWAVVRRVQQVEREAEADALPYDLILRRLQKGKEDSHNEPLFRVRFLDEMDTPMEQFISTTNVTSDLTIYVTRPPATSRQSIAPNISLRIIYNSLLFTSARISIIVEQLVTFLRKVSSNPLSSVGSVPLLTPSQGSKLPDPTSDLDWCGWKGAITDVFSRNARLHPDRPCVVQYLPAPSGSVSEENVVFSYGDILRTSNILSHHLIKNGIERGEVVMIYAHRSVDLVVAVMAVLKAGAIFSVIGQYPFLFN